MTYDRCSECNALMVATQESAEFGMCPNGHGPIVECKAVPQGMYGKIEALMALPVAECVGRTGRRKLFIIGETLGTLSKTGSIKARRFWGEWKAERFEPCT